MKKPLPLLFSAAVALFLPCGPAVADDVRLPVTLNGSVKRAATAKSKLEADFQGSKDGNSIRGSEAGAGPAGRIFGPYHVVARYEIQSGGAMETKVDRGAMRLSRTSLETPYGKIHLNSPLDADQSGRQRFRGRGWFLVPELVSDDDKGEEPWISDGSNAGTRLLKDIHPTGDSRPREFNEIDGKVVFSADDGTHGRELWVSDGTRAGTVLLKDIQPGATGSQPQQLEVIDGVLYFNADDGIHGAELWKSDGTPEGTVLVADLYPGGTSESAMPRYFRKTNGHVIFWAYNGIQWNLWRTDGTGAGTVLLANLKLPADGNHMLALGNDLIFTVWTESTHELWKTDGTTGGTIRLRAGNFYAKCFVTIAGGSYFIRNNVGTTELWRTDGTSSGTIFIRSFPNANLWSMAALNDRLYFGIEDGSDNSFDLWTSDGTHDGTYELHPIIDGFSQIQDFVPVNGELLFRVNDSTNQYELWKTDGTTNGTALLTDLPPAGYSADVDALTLVGDTLFFSAKDAEGDRELWSTDGTAAGTRKVGTLMNGPGNPAVREITPFGTGVVFSANNSGASSGG
jgi:ELWxxDGT repeat protein